MSAVGARIAAREASTAGPEGYRESGTSPPATDVPGGGNARSYARPAHSRAVTDRRAYVLVERPSLPRPTGAQRVVVAEWLADLLIDSLEKVTRSSEDRSRAAPNESVPRPQKNAGRPRALVRLSATAKISQTPRSDREATWCPACGVGSGVPPFACSHCGLGIPAGALRWHMK
jgi:hypothetical protein